MGKNDIRLCHKYCPFDFVTEGQQLFDDTVNTLKKVIYVKERANWTCDIADAKDDLKVFADGNNPRDYHDHIKQRRKKIKDMEKDLSQEKEWLPNHQIKRSIIGSKCHLCKDMIHQNYPENEVKQLREDIESSLETIQKEAKEYQENNIIEDLFQLDMFTTLINQKLMNMFGKKNSQ